MHPDIVKLYKNFIKGEKIGLFAAILLICAVIFFQLLGGNLNNNALIAKLFSFFLMFGIDMTIMAIIVKNFKINYWLSDSIFFTLILIGMQSAFFNYIFSNSKFFYDAIITNFFFIVLLVYNLYLFKNLKNKNTQVEINTDSIVLKINKLIFLSETDKNMFFYWLEHIKSFANTQDDNEFFYILLNKKKYEETKTDLKELAALFHRYNISDDALNEIDT